MVFPPINEIDATGICDEKITKPRTALHKIQIRTSLTKKYLDNYPKGYDVAMFYDGKKMKYVKSITSGANGEILIFSHDKYSIVLKKAYSDPYEEPLIIRDYVEKSNGCQHYLIPFRVIFDQNMNPFVIMQEANGDMVDLHLKDSSKRKLINMMAEFMQCFLENGLVYSDFKLENLLYKCEGKNMSVFLGDFGSFEKIGEENLITTFPPPEVLDNRGKNDETLAYYIFGATVAQLYNLDYHLFWETEDKNGKTRVKSSKEMREIFYPKFKKNIQKSNIDSDIKKLILEFTNPDVEMRRKCNFKRVKL